MYSFIGCLHQYSASLLYSVFLQRQKPHRTDPSVWWASSGLNLSGFREHYMWSRPKKRHNVYVSPDSLKTSHMLWYDSKVPITTVITLSSATQQRSLIYRKEQMFCHLEQPLLSCESYIRDATKIYICSVLTFDASIHSIPVTWRQLRTEQKRNKALQC